MTQLHADLPQPATVRTDDLPWDPSSAPGVHRRRIERNGDEVARLTSIVRYAAGSRFPPHTHGGGEEYLVLEGTFSDEHGDHPPGTYVRNGVGTTHAPYTEDGCTILVRLWWMHPEETASSVRAARPGCSTRADMSVSPSRPAMNPCPSTPTVGSRCSCCVVAPGTTPSTPGCDARTGPWS